VDGEQYVAVMVGPGGSAGVSGGSPDAPHYMPNGRVMVFKLGGAAALPAYTPRPLPPANPPAETFTPVQESAGGALYGQYCVFCHAGYILPDLRRSQALANKDAWHEIVIEGELEPGGMASFKDYLSADEAEDIRAYVASLARDLQKDDAAAAVSH
jgi:quinohemoprotein ethanol dehydrogenase